MTDEELVADFITAGMLRCESTARSCKDCGFDTMAGNEYYMVKDEVWAAAGMTRGFLCVGCLEARVGTLSSEHFRMDLPINAWSLFKRSERLQTALSRCSCNITEGK